MVELGYMGLVWANHEQNLFFTQALLLPVAVKAFSL